MDHTGLLCTGNNVSNWRSPHLSQGPFHTLWGPQCSRNSKPLSLNSPVLSFGITSCRATTTCSGVLCWTTIPEVGRGGKGQPSPCPPERSGAQGAVVNLMLADLLNTCFLFAACQEKGPDRFWLCLQQLEIKNLVFSLSGLIKQATY